MAFEENVDQPRPVVRDQPMVDPAYRQRFVRAPRREHFSLGATFFGWAVAAFFTGVFTAAALLFFGIGFIAGPIDIGTAQGATIGLMVALLLGVFAAYYLGGYVAGRMSLWKGPAHGAAVVAWTVFFAVIYWAFSVAVGATAFVTVPFTGNDLLIVVVVGAIVTLALALGGAMLGGRVGERYLEVDTIRERRVMHRRGRPL